MKYLLITLAFVIGCKSKKEAPISEDNGLSISKAIPFDTTVVQEVWYDDGEYALQTYLLTDPQQSHYPEAKKKSHNMSFGSSGNTSAFPQSPYNKTIYGSFSFIKKSKPSQYESAIKYMATVRASKTSEQAIADSVKMLQEFPATPKEPLMPRMNGTQMMSIENPGTGLIVYNTDSAKYCYYNGERWVKIAKAEVKPN